MMSLGQVAEATNVHLDTKAAPHRIHLELMLKLPLMRNFTYGTETSGPSGYTYTHMIR